MYVSPMRPLPFRRAWLFLPVVVSFACGDKADPANDPAKKKKDADDAVAILTASVGKISAFLPHIILPKENEPYAPANRNSEVRAATAAANEVRHEATSARQLLKKIGSPLTAAVETAFDGVSTACADAVDAPKIEGCLKAVTALDEALGKLGPEATAAGAGSKVPRVGKDGITKEGTAATQPLVGARGPGPAETDYRKKRNDPKAAYDDIDKACVAAEGEADQAAQQYENADEPIRLVAVTRQMSMKSQCKRLRTAAQARTDLEVCKKTPKSSECATACGKAQAVVDEGVPAAIFDSLKKEQEEACKQIK